MKLSLKTKYSLIILTSILSVLILLTGAVLLHSKFSIQRITQTSARIMEERLLIQIEKRIEAMIASLSEKLSGNLEARDMEALAKVVDPVAGQQDISYVYVYDRDGRIVYDGTKEGALINSVPQDAISKNASGAKELLFQFTKNTLDAAIPIKINGKLLGGVRVGFFLKTVLLDIDEMKKSLTAISEEGIRQSIIVIAIIAVLLSAFGMIIAILVARKLTRPIDALSSLTARIRSGEYNITIPAEELDQIGELSSTFNKMTKDLKETTFSRNFLNNILKSMVDPLIVADSTQTIMMVNKATCYLLGYKKEEDLIGQPLEAVFTMAIRESAEAKKLIKLINQGIMYYETSFQAKRGEDIPVLISGSAIRDERENIIWTICTAVDISKRKLAENNLQNAYLQLKETQSQLIQAAKMEAIGKMASGIAHEVKNPLGVILQGVNCLEMRLPPKQKDTFDILQKIKNNVERADGIIRGLLDFSKLTELMLEPEDINAITESALGLIHHRVRLERIEVVKEMQKDLPSVRVDRRKIEQVFVNILLNAIQAMPDGGKLFIRSYITTFKKSTVTAENAAGDYFKKGQKVVIAEVEDTGHGIDEDIARKIFDPFFTTKGPQEGTGLGLSVTRNIIDMHKAYIGIESKKNKGTKVILVFKAEEEGK